MGFSHGTVIVKRKQYRIIRSKYSKTVNLYVLFTDYKLAFYKVYAFLIDKISLHKA